MPDRKLSFSRGGKRRWRTFWRRRAGKRSREGDVKRDRKSAQSSMSRRVTRPSIPKQTLSNNPAKRLDGQSEMIGYILVRHWKIEPSLRFHSFRKVSQKGSNTTFCIATNQNGVILRAS